MRKRLVGYDAVTRLQRAAVFVCVALGLLVSPITGAEAETRTLKLYNTHTKEKVSVTFKKNGRYIPSGLREANRFLRDWRRNEMTKIDPELLDLIWEVYRKVRAKDHVYVVSSYRSPATNNMLRKRSKGVAKNSQHTLGKAMDFYIPGVKLSELRAAGLRKEVGGVGYYPRSGSPFVHMDTGRVRHWPRMSRSQLVKVFPNGRTLHIPSDGKPLKGYKVALAEAKSGKKRKTRPTLVASAPERPARTNEQKLTNPSNNSGQGGGNILSNLFRSNNNSESAERSRVAAVRPDRANVPPGALPGVNRSGDSSPAGRNAPAVTAPPIPADKDRVVLAGIVPAAKPARQPAAPLQVASANPAANTLDAQRVALENGGTSPSASAPVGGRFDVAAAQPNDKPMDRLIRASQQAALERASAAGRVPVPQQSPALDPVSAIAAATGSQVPSVKPAPPGTLAYASATALPAALKQRAEAAQNGFSTASISNSRPKRPAAPSVSGRIPMNEIEDPLAGFAGLPDKSEPRLISGQSTTRHRHFADLRHPHQRTMDKLLAPSNRFVSSGFEKFPYGSLRTDRFDGPAVIVLPVTFAR